jgi:NAD(P)-dependent dehydrogenase (short-subunit alcohol dehydrogenase family)
MERPMTGLCDGRVVIVTGAGRGIGRAEALDFGRAGARVVVNSLSSERTHATVDAIREAGGEAVGVAGDVADMAVARELLQGALNSFGRLDVLVNNAGAVRDRMLVNMTEIEWDEAVRINLRGSYTTMHVCARYWRDCSRTQEVQAAIVNTTSAAGLYRNLGQTNYAAAKAGVASLTIIASEELRRYGVTVNAVAPAASTDMSAHLIDPAVRYAGDFDLFAPENIAPLVVWLGSAAARDVTGRVFDIKGGRIAIAEGWHLGPQLDIGRRWELHELTPALEPLLSRARENATVDGVAPPRPAGRQG